MTASEIVLNIAVNLGRLSRWASEGKVDRIGQFIEDTESYIGELEKIERSKKFEKTFNLFKISFEKLKKNKRFDYDWAEEALTWANILSHRAKLA